MYLNGAISFFSARRQMWQDLIGEVTPIHDVWRDRLAYDYRTWKDTKTAAGHAVPMVKVALEAASNAGIKKSQDPLASLPLQERVDRLSRNKAVLNDPVQGIGLTAEQRELTSRTWDRFEKAIRDGNAAEAKHAVSGNFGMRKFYYGITFNSQKLNDLRAVERHMVAASSRVDALKKLHTENASLDTSIKTERKEVADTIATLSRKGRLGDMIASLGAAEVSKSPVLQALSDITRKAPDLKAKTITKYMEAQGINISHKQLLDTMNAGKATLTARVEADKAKYEATKEKVNAVKEFKTQLSTFVRRETEMSVGGKSQPVDELLKKLNDGELDEKTATALSQRLTRVTETWADQHAVTLVHQSFQILSKPDFKVADLPRTEIKTALRDQQALYMGMRVREGVQSVSDWGKRIKEIISERVQKTLDSAKVGIVSMTLNMGNIPEDKSLKKDPNRVPGSLSRILNPQEQDPILVSAHKDAVAGARISPAAVNGAALNGASHHANGSDVPPAGAKSGGLQLNEPTATA